ncbi:hypothetical protein F4802DRAFT_597535 [Xylaria palmicola]|nr:hypothetical protein F4802DRAFT_597535 [Xylaria palmicola]
MAERVNTEVDHNQDSVITRITLAGKYKAIENVIIPSLFPPGSNSREWTREQLLTRLTSERALFSQERKENAIREIKKAVRLRREARAASTLQKTASPPSAPLTLHIDPGVTIVLPKRIGSTQPEPQPELQPELQTEPQTEPQPEPQPEPHPEPQPEPRTPPDQILPSSPGSSPFQEVDESEEGGNAQAWPYLDFDIHASELMHWRKLLLEAWEGAIANPVELSVADISAGCMIKYIRHVFSTLRESYPEWFTDDGQYRHDVLVEATKRDDTGIVRDLIKAIEDLEKPDMKERLKSLIDQNQLNDFPPKIGDPFSGDVARHVNQYVTWVCTLLDAGDDYASNPEMAYAWVLISDTLTLAPGELQRLRRAAIARLIEVQKVSRMAMEGMGDDEQVTRMTNAILARVAAMNRYALRQAQTAPSLAVIFTWADYAHMITNAFLFATPPLMVVFFVLDAKTLLGRRANDAVTAALEALCGRYARYIYLTWRGRPTSEAAWKEAMTAITTQESDMLRRANKLTEIHTFDTWVTIALSHDYITPIRFGFYVAPGCDEWWRKVRELAKFELQGPSGSLVCANMVRGGPLFGDTQMLWDNIARLRIADWTEDRAWALNAVDWFKFEPSWFAAAP